MALVSFALLFFTGCQTAFVGSPSPLSVSISLSGKIRGGQQAIANSAVQLYEVDLSKTGMLSNQPLLARGARSDSNGAFTVHGTLTCSSPEAEVYVLASGGAVPAIRTNNPNISLVSMLGPCSGLTSYGAVTVNEVTTIGSIFPFASILASPSVQASLSTMQQSTVAGLFVNAIYSVSAMVNIHDGTSPGATTTSGSFGESSKLNTLANALASCVDSSGGSAGDSSACGRLFQLATFPGVPVPADTATAAVEIALNPNTNVAGLYQLAASSSAYQPNLTGPPADWTLSTTQPVTTASSGSVTGANSTTSTAAPSSASTGSSIQAPSGSAASPSNAYSGPIRITAGGTYTGRWQSLDPNTPAISIATDQPVVIQNSVVKGPSNLIVAHGGSAGVHLQILNVVGQALNPNVSGQATGSFLYADGVTSLDVEHSSMTGVSSGLYIAKSTATYLHIDNNIAINMDDRGSDGNGGKLATRPGFGHFIIFDTVSAPSGADLGWNQVINVVGQSSTEDIINIDSSRGGSTSTPINIHDNYLQGAVSAVGKAYTGGGIITDGDQSSASTETAYVLINNNQIVQTQNNGISIPTGHDITVSNNRVVSTGQDSSGNWLAPSDNLGCGYCLVSNQPSQYYNILFTNNYGGLARMGPGGSGSRADTTLTGVSAAKNNVAQGFTLISPATSASAVTSAMQAQEYSSWGTKLLGAKQSLGAPATVVP